MTDRTSTSPIAVQFPLSDEDRARAEFYAVVGRLLVAPPDRALLAAIGSAPLVEDGERQPITAAWRRLVEASQVMDEDAAAQEYTELFIGVGKAECNLHASYWVRDSAQRPLVAIRTALADLGLARAAQATIYEDHLGALCETMRILVAGAPGHPPVPVAVQQAFFERQIAPWALSCCDAIRNCTVANYYARVGQFAEAFLAVERDALAIE